MIEYSFLHIQGVGEKTERGLWHRGILTWEDFLRYEGTVFSAERDRFIRAELEESIRHREDIRFFGDRLPSSEHWRLYESFRERAVFLDIETSGGYQGMDEISLIGIYGGKQLRTLVSGKDLTDFEMVIDDFDLIITFNGTGFDLPFIRRSFPHITLPGVHIDLRFLLKRLGYRGGLKKVELQLGIRREAAVEGLSGFDAVRLWKAFQWGDHSALERLTRYNAADVLNLEPLMETANREMKAKLLPQARSMQTPIGA